MAATIRHKIELREDQTVRITHVPCSESFTRVPDSGNGNWTRVRNADMTRLKSTNSVNSVFCITNRNQHLPTKHIFVKSTSQRTSTEHERTVKKGKEF